MPNAWLVEIIVRVDSARYLITIKTIIVETIYIYNFDNVSHSIYVKAI